LEKDTSGIPRQKDGEARQTQCAGKKRSDGPTSDKEDGSEPELTVVVTNHNLRHSLELCLETLHAYNQIPKKLVIVDDVSTDGSRDYIRKLAYPSVKMGKKILLKNRTGHPRTLNIGIKHVDTPYFLCLDADVEFLRAGCIGDMMELMLRSPTNFAVGQYVKGYHINTKERDKNDFTIPCVKFVGTDMDELFSFERFYMHPRMHTALLLVDTEKYRRIGGRFTQYMLKGHGYDGGSYVYLKGLKHGYSVGKINGTPIMKKFKHYDGLSLYDMSPGNVARVKAIGDEIKRKCRERPWERKKGARKKSVKSQIGS